MPCPPDPSPSIPLPQAGEGRLHPEDSGGAISSSPSPAVRGRGRGEGLRRLLPLLLLVLAPPTSAEISIDVPRFALAGRDLRLSATVTDVPANRKLRIFVLLDGRQVRTVDLGSGVHHLRFEALRPPAGRHEIALQVGRERAAGFVRVLPWWGVLSAALLPAALLLLVVELMRKRWPGARA